ncbi:putative type IV pilus assembly protein fimt [uncultured Stenotrophomonas sp.]|uniref:Type II secretion system protein H n=1 Tax=uncultured Stenotrophomonas sp. TaxID=165438 RepID=A0A1Y5PZP7_9GAMM|nr:putative type IV pilus assembly protein fimt [uncultured Stenotrophomonas sp.]
MAGMPTTPPNRHVGITLVEVIVCVCVLSISAAIALPSMAPLVERQRAISAGNALLTQLAMTRMAAITHRSHAALCPSTNSLTCNAGTDWSGGWLLFLDRDGNRRPDNVGDILHADNTPPSRHLRLTSSTGRHQVRYLPDGRSAGTNLTIAICNRKGELLSSVIVNTAGRARNSRPAHSTTCPY